MAKSVVSSDGFQETNQNQNKLQRHQITRAYQHSWKWEMQHKDFREKVVGVNVDMYCNYGKTF